MLKRRRDLPHCQRDSICIRHTPLDHHQIPETNFEQRLPKILLFYQIIFHLKPLRLDVLLSTTYAEDNTWQTRQDRIGQALLSPYSGFPKTVLEILAIKRQPSQQTKTAPRISNIFKIHFHHATAPCSWIF